MKISNEKATAAAEKIAAPLREKIVDYKKKMSSDILSEYRAETPKEVLACFKKHPSFFHTESSVYIGRFNGNYMYANFGVATPILHNFLTDERKRAFSKHINALEALQEEYDSTVLKIKNTILALGTMKRVQSEFPEAAPYIDMPKPNMAVAINITPVRKLACGLIPNCKSVTNKP